MIHRVVYGSLLIKRYYIVLVSILLYTSIELIPPPPLYLRKYSKMRAFYWQMQNQYDFKLHTVNHATL